MKGYRKLLVYSESFKKHDPNPYSHPENPERIKLMIEGLKKYSLINSFRLIDPPLEDPRIFEEVHSKDYVNYILAERRNVEWIDPDTYISPGTLEALKAESGSAHIAAEGVEESELILMFPRPPGHHAGKRGKALRAPTQGFCIFNVSALIAQLLVKRGYKVAILDFDAHHGNGTQEIFYERKEILHVDIHQDSSSIYPGTGFPEECGKGEGKGTKVNINLPPGSGDDIFLDASKRAIEMVKEREPDVLIVDAGFDGYFEDNFMVSLRITSSSFNSLGRGLRSLGLKLIVVVEGGYGAGLLRGLPSFISGLLGKDDPVGDLVTDSKRSTWRSYLNRLEELKNALA